MKLTREGGLHNNAGPIIRKLRKASKTPITQEDLSRRLAARGITLDRTAISRIEKQKRVIYDFELVAIARALKVPASKLLGEK